MSQNSSQSAIGTSGQLVWMVISGLIGILSGFGLLFWVISFLINPNNPILGSTSIGLAPAVAIFGVFGWTGGTALNLGPALRARLRQTGIAYTVAALFLVIMGMLLPMIEVGDTSTTGYWILAWVYVGLTFASAIAFGGGTWLLLSSLVSLWTFRDQSQSP